MRSGVVLLFSLTAFLASFLLFWAEPMIGKMVLPLFGGTPAVWNTCLVYFQSILLCGYAAFGGALLSRGRPDKLVSPFYLVFVATILALGCAGGPIAPDPGAVNPEDSPVARLLATLATSVSIPLLMVAAAAPLLQGWFSLTGHARADDPYFLYAASNAGSLLALLAYPSAIEPSLSLGAQARLWKTGFILVAILLSSCGLIARRLSRRRPSAQSRLDLAPAERPTISEIAGWLLLVFVPSSWLMGVTTYLTTDLAPMPLLWVIPLALYLASYIVAFSRPDSTVVRRAATVLPFLVLPLVLVLSAGFVHAIWIPLHLVTFFAGAVACHGALARQRPHARSLSAYYVSIAVGGLLGGVFNAIVAPVVFTRVVEYPLAVVLAAAIAPAVRCRKAVSDIWLPGTVFALTALLVTNPGGLSDSLAGAAGVIIASGLVCYSMIKASRRPLRFALSAGAVMAASGLSQGAAGRLLHIERNFFGVLRVTEDAGHTVHRLIHGSTLHGQQSLDPTLAREPSTFFTRSGPIGQLFGALDLSETRIAIVGLGAGTLAAYAGPSQDWRFYEIDPAIERIARDPRHFTYLRDCRANSLDVVLGDARLRLREATDRTYRLIVLDAFSSDSLPVHLITREAIRLYRSKLVEAGVLAFNLSNRYLDLEPLMGRQAEDAGLAARICYDTVVSEDERAAGKQPSIWAVMAAREVNLGTLAQDSRWRHLRTRPGSRGWTDDFSDLASYLRWKPIRTTTPRDGADL